MKKGVEQKKKEPKPKKGGLFQSLRLSSKMSILIGLCSAIALIGTGFILINISKSGMEKTVDSNMVDKTHMAIRKYSLPESGGCGNHPRGHYVGL